MNVTRQIVVGVDGSSGADAALRWAIREAHDRGGRVRAVVVYQPSPPVVTEAQARGEAEATLATATSSATAMAAKLSIIGEITSGEPAAALVEAAADADLLVLGSHGHSRLHHTLLGSVTEICARTATCPVVVIPAMERQRVAATQLKPAVAGAD
jgi:nucleotide-binding universal stress UspA family protein